VNSRDDQRVVEVLIVSGSASFRDHLRGRLTVMHWHLVEAETGADALDQLYQRPSLEVILLDPVLPDLLPAEFAGIVRQRFPHVAIMTMNTQTGKVQGGNTAPNILSSQLDELLFGGPVAAPFKPLPAPVIYPKNGAAANNLPGMVGNSQVMQQTYALVHKVAARNTTVMITGESGTGKDLIAQAIHSLSARREAPFVVVNCAAIPEALLEAELFGYAKGAFTGAMQSRMGRIHAAQGGTLFLDEIGDMPLALQRSTLSSSLAGQRTRT
jgi:DNA-binding NtrC family response regulator